MCGGPHHCGADRWTGEWPGESDAIALGWFSYFDPADGGWVRCGPDHPRASPDLNRLFSEGFWTGEHWIERGIVPVVGEPDPSVTWADWLRWCARRHGRHEPTDDEATWILWGRTPFPVASADQVRRAARVFFITEAI